MQNSFHYCCNNCQSSNHLFTTLIPLKSCWCSLIFNPYRHQHVHPRSGKTDRRATEKGRREESDWLSWWPWRQSEDSYIKLEGEWPSQVNRLWAVSHSWHTHNYSISSTINGNTLKLQAEIKQIPYPYSSNLSASTRPPISPFCPFTSKSLRAVISVQHSI